MINHPHALLLQKFVVILAVIIGSSCLAGVSQYFFHAPPAAGFTKTHALVALCGFLVVVVSALAYFAMFSLKDSHRLQEEYWRMRGLRDPDNPVR